MSRLIRTIRSASCTTTLGVLALIGFASLIAAGLANDDPVLPVGCEHLQVPDGNVLSFHTFATGVQIYRWNAAANRWDFLGPEATLYADASLTSVVGTHYAGPTWESNSGSKVVGTLVDSCPADPTAIRWLKLAAVTSNGPGVFNKTTFIQRVNTTGGLIPTSPGTPDEIVEVPYTAEYYFYKKQ
jgi:Protein of unknown function (DUF3455)